MAASLITKYLFVFFSNCFSVAVLHVWLLCLLQLMTDLDVGIGMDEVLKIQSQHEAQWMYQFNFNSWNNWLPDYMGGHTL